MLCYKVYNDAEREQQEKCLWDWGLESPCHNSPTLENITEYGGMKPSANCPGAAREKKWLLYPPSRQEKGNNSGWKPSFPSGLNYS